MKERFFSLASEIPEYKYVRTAEFLSLCSASSQENKDITSNVSSAFDSICILLVTSLAKPWNNDTLYRTLGNKAYYNNYEGKWAIVQDLLHQGPNFDKIIDRLLLYFSEDTINGNIIPRGLDLIYYCKIRERREGLRKVKYSQRKRGYNDKGTLRPRHKAFRIFGEDEETIPPDGRSFIEHPLLKIKETEEVSTDRNAFYKYLELSLKEFKRKERDQE